VFVTLQLLFQILAAVVVALALVAIVVGVTYYLMDLEKEREKAEMRAELAEEEAANFGQTADDVGSALGQGALRSEASDGGGRLSVKSGRRVVSSEKFDVRPTITAIKSSSPTTAATTTTVATSPSAAKKQTLSLDRWDQRSL
jgi:hypothetical protein